MRPIQRNRYGTQGIILPKLTAEMVPGDKPVLTVERVQEFPGPDGPFLSIIFGEFPEHSYNTNSTQEDALIALVDARKLPNDFDVWAGKRIPFFKKENVFTGKGKGGTEPEYRVTKLYAVDPEDFDATIAAFDAGRQPAGNTGATQQAPAKQTARRTARS
jgi:hypothetical protein